MSNYLEAQAQPTETDAIAQAATKRSHATFPHITEDGSLTTNQTVYRDRDGAEKIDARTHENTRLSPYRQRGVTKLTDITSFISLENRLSDPDIAATFSDPDTRTLTTVLNYQDGWGDHGVSYNPGYHPDFAKWLERDGQWMTQTDFAELLQDLRHTIIDPTAADIVQIARTFTATRTAEFESGVRLSSGDVQFSYVEETRAKSGGTVAVPETITLRLAPFRDSPELVDVDLDFRYDAGKNGLRLGYRIIRRDELLENSWNTILDFAKEHLTSPVYTGPAPRPVTALD